MEASAWRLPGSISGAAQLLASEPPVLPPQDPDWLLPAAGRLAALLSLPRAVVAAGERFALAETLPIGVAGGLLSQPALQRVSGVATSLFEDIPTLVPLIERGGALGAAAGRLPVVGATLQVLSWADAARRGQDVAPIIVADVAATAVSTIAGAVALDAAAAGVLALGLATPAAPLVVAVAASTVVAMGIGRLTAAALTDTGAAAAVARGIRGTSSVLLRGSKAIDDAAGELMEDAAATVRRGAARAADAAERSLQSAWRHVFG